MLQIKWIDIYGGTGMDTYPATINVLMLAVLLVVLCKDMSAAGIHSAV
jgi:hypothetical protein